ncbi:MAG: hypothetical protein ACRC0X_00785 [Brevinema sp.]
MKNLLLGFLILTTGNLFADDIWFISPRNGQPIQNTLEIQIQPPFGNVPSVNVWIEYDMGRDQIVWWGTLTKQNNYKVVVDVSKFQPGKYEVQAEYYMFGKEFDGDVDIWIGGSSQEQYFPQN